MRARLSVGLTALLLLIAVAPSAAAAPTTPPPGSSSATTSGLRALARAQTALLLSHYRGGSQSASPSACGKDQPPSGVGGVFLLPVLSFAPGSREFWCQTTAGAVLVDRGGAVITEDDRFPASSYVTSNGFTVPFSRANLAPICDDLLGLGAFDSPVPTTVDGIALDATAPIDSGLLVADVGRHAQGAGIGDLYGDSVALGHPGRLAAVFCGTKTVVSLAPGRHTVVVHYGGLFPQPDDTTFTFHVLVRA